MDVVIGAKRGAAQGVEASVTVRQGRVLNLDGIRSECGRCVGKISKA